MAEWNNSSQNAPDTHELENLSTLRSTLTEVNCRYEEEQNIHNGDHRSQTPPGSLRNPEEEIDIMKNLMDTNIEELGRLIVKVLQFSNRPVQDASCPARRNRSFIALQADFRSKMDQLEKAVGGILIYTYLVMSSHPVPSRCVRIPEFQAEEDHRPPYLDTQPFRPRDPQTHFLNTTSTF
ncbi:unnamed protein product [Ranitomeya imitator]|uniref:Uncharacterized protein n=1 Tax=Ranitomeya imitator TaxID=111125 RepID=A0ABN9LL97_9NEOB|nr:unnamed protein product [Ranitomeya imitator]